MSLDIYLVGSHCEHCGRDGETFYDANITHNVIPMWSKADVYEALYMSDGHKASEYIDALERGVAHFEANYAEYQLLHASNGWGKAEHALPWLKKTHAAFKQHPDAIINVSK